MAKQTIEIDVPDGYDIDNVLLCTSLMSDDNRDQFYRVQFKNKEPEFIEVREFLRKTYDGILHADSITNGHHCTPDEAEKLVSFIKWIDKDWRKVEI